MDKAFWGSMRWGYFRWGVYTNHWDTLLKQFETVASHDLTLRKLTLGSRDSTTGWRAKEYTESTIEGILIDKASSYQALPPGTYVRTDALLITADGVHEGGEIKTSNNEYYEVKGIRERYFGNSFYYRECDLTKLPLHT